MANMRTATTATDKSSTGGICQARVISHAETPARASALPSDSAPSATAARIRGSRGRNRDAAMRRGSDSRIKRLSVRDHLDDLIANCPYMLAVADHDHGRAGARTLDDGAQHPVLGVGVQMRGGFVEQ